MRRILLAALSGAVLLTTPLAASAQPPDRSALAARLTHEMFGAVDFEGLLIRAIEADAGNFLGELAARPEWNGYLKDALREEARHDQPAFKALVARIFARELTAEQLAVGLELLTDPSTRAIFTAGAQESGAETPPPSAKAQRLAASPAGRAFLGKMAQIDKLMGTIEDEMLVEIVPGTFRRFADKIDAGEARRAASPR